MHLARAGDGPFGGTVAHGFLTLSLIREGETKPACVAETVVLLLG